MLLELVQGGELFGRLGELTVDDARLLGACVLDALHALHSANIVYRDLKPENLLLDDKGYIKVADFGFAKVMQDDRQYTLCGTVEYLCPEIIMGQGHHHGVDVWALGVLLFEMACGYTPFADDNDDQMAVCTNILTGEVAWPDHVTDPALQEVVAGMLQSDMTERLGCLAGGLQQVKDADFFKGVDFAVLRARGVPMAWVPPIKDATDASNFDEYDEDDPAEYTAVPDADWCDGF